MAASDIFLCPPPSPNDVKLYDPAAGCAGGGNVTITTGLGSLIITGFSPVINLSIVSNVGQLTINGLSPVINSQIISQVGDVVINGFAPLVNQNIIAGLGQLTLSGFAPTINLIAGGVTITPSFGELILTGFSPTIIVPEIIDPPALQIQVENRYSLGRVTTKRPYQRRY